MADVDILIVSWNVGEILVRCLESLLDQEGAEPPVDGVIKLGDHRLRVHVVDNASSDGTADILRNRFPWVHLLISDVNLGFTGGNNLGLRHATGDYVLLLNPDTELAPDAVLAMLSPMESNPRVGIVGPRLVYGDGTPQPSRRRFPTLPMALFESTLLEQWFPRNRWARAYRMEDTPADVAQQVDWMTGACLLTRRTVWDQIGLLDDRFFMYSEELDWCRRAADAGWTCLYVPDAHVVHHEGKSSGQIVARRHYLFNSSKVLYWEKHHGSGQARILRWFLLSTFAIQLVVESIKWLLGHRRGLRRERIDAYRWVLATGLRRPTDGMDEVRA